ncbi:MAG: phosphoribosylformylglycinamidine cyclo-ligase [Verrucomicrobiales bacterium]|nr:phosphoribosylformylglycinamidine cyclo-ligase [Verrucomicrobiales bacterium]
MKKPQKAYAAAGVDIDLGNRVKSTLPQLLASTHRKEVLGKVGGFGGLFALDTRHYREPILVSSVDGVGTKLKIAFALGRHDTIGQDLVNHCVNDIAVLGAEPLFFLDYLGTGKLEPHVFGDIIRGFALACAQNHCALIGGETAQLPGFYQEGEYDVSGTIVGVVERSRMLDGPRNVRPGDVVLGMVSTGLHTNGYSLARKILLDDLGLKLSRRLPGFTETLGETLLATHVSYGPAIQKLLRRFNPSPAPSGKRPAAKYAPNAVRALAHITGGGFVDNIPRVLADDCDVIVRKDSWEPLPIFRFLRERGGVDEAELYQVFNMGIGMVAIVAPDAATRIARFLTAAGHPTSVIGEVTRGSRRVRLV